MASRDLWQKPACTTTNKIIRSVSDRDISEPIELVHGQLLLVEMPSEMLAQHHRLTCGCKVFNACAEEHLLDMIASTQHTSTVRVSQGDHAADIGCHVL